jgi:hypothetical protein
MQSRDAYYVMDYLKERDAKISSNFEFMYQLMDYDTDRSKVRNKFL